jgi:outer membrane lipoprotein carrier protein
MTVLLAAPLVAAGARESAAPPAAAAEPAASPTATAEPAAPQPAAQAPAPTAPDSRDPWAVLEQARGRLAAAGPLAAQFEQSYVPAGFSSGEDEKGRLALHLPDCLRWDYDEPYPKSFLVCDDVVYYWNAADGTGRRQTIDSANEPGLDLLLLSVDALRRRYQATAAAGTDGRVLIHLAPKGEEGEIREATLDVEPASGRVAALDYADREGNRTRFTLTDYAPAATADLFTPPAGIAWQEQ